MLSFQSLFFIIWKDYTKVILSILSVDTNFETRNRAVSLIFSPKDGYLGMYADCDLLEKVRAES